MTSEYDALLRLVEQEAEAVVRRLRGWSPGAWQAAAPPFANRAELVHHVAGMLAAAAQGVEDPAADPAQWHRVPPLPPHALADAVAVTAYDAVTALRAVPPEAVVRGARADLTAGRLAAELAAELFLHRRELDGTRPGRRTTALLRAALGTEGDPFALAAERCLRA